MFIQVIQGKVGEKEALRAAMDRWASELGSAATGWLGSTAGVTDDGTAVVLARFESEDAARRNSDRPEQGQWWADVEKLFTGPVTFHDCREVLTLGRGGSDNAGFVQVIQGRAKDEERLRQESQEFDRRIPTARPDLIGAIVALHGDGGFTQAAYFTAEAEARQAEANPTPEAAEAQNELMSLIEDVRYYDLHDPWLQSPA